MKNHPPSPNRGVTSRDDYLGNTVLNFNTMQPTLMHIWITTINYSIPLIFNTHIKCIHLINN